MDRLRARITDKRVCAVVKAFLKSGVLTELGLRKETPTEAPQGGILSPLLASISLSTLDDHFERRWREMGSRYQRAKRKMADPRRVDVAAQSRLNYSMGVSFGSKPAVRRRRRSAG
ncbi:hypothetical protein ABZX92_32465 [Lentzea sp. NPDC006480]|uniref:hypothetical protein n=1 Tax=Lentzea sp. NPDC006480 TaxID=3157176 RepID=UPI0033B6ED45